MNPEADLARLTGRDPIEVLSSTPANLAAIVEATPADLLRTRPYPGKWTPNEILGHLVDHEWAAGVRYRNAMFAEPPSFAGYDQERWVAGRHVNDIDPSEHVEEFGKLRPHNLRLISNLPEALLERTITPISASGSPGRPATVRQAIIRYAAHDLTHLDQLRRYVEAVSDRLGR